jgi:hypothetical protein
MRGAVAVGSYGFIILYVQLSIESQKNDELEPFLIADETRMPLRLPPLVYLVA